MVRSHLVSRSQHARQGSTTSTAVHLICKGTVPGYLQSCFTCLADMTSRQRLRSSASHRLAVCEPSQFLTPAHNDLPLHVTSSIFLHSAWSESGWGWVGGKYKFLPSRDIICLSCVFTWCLSEGDRDGEPWRHWPTSTSNEGWPCLRRCSSRGRGVLDRLADTVGVESQCQRQWQRWHLSVSESTGGCWWPDRTDGPACC